MPLTLWAGYTTTGLGQTNLVVFLIFTYNIPIPLITYLDQ